MPLKLDVKKKLVARSERVKCVDIHPTENWLLVSLYDGKVHIWNYESQQQTKTFEVNDGPVRVAKFVPRKNWIVCGSDDFRIYVYNYNTSERVKQLDAHSDYVRSIAIHPTLPYILSSSDDMSIKLWDWDKDFRNVQVFEGHAHYVMQVVINPKDSNTFASASLDGTLKVWQLGSADANFTLEGHRKGVNCVDYYPGGDKPYLLSGSDDKTVKIWDYQTKTCVQTLEGHSENISSVMYYPDLPIILTSSEDSSVRVWNMNTYRLEQTFNYGMRRVWAMAALKNSNTLAIGYDEGAIVLKLGREEPAMSMDINGKIVWARQNELQQAHIKKLERERIKDGAILPLQVKDMGTCEIYPQSLQHNSNGQYLVVCGDGQFITHTALTLRNKDFGNALEFVWANDPKTYAIRDHNEIKIFKDSKLHRPLKPDFGCEGIFGGYMLGVNKLAGLAFHDWDTLELIRLIEVDAKAVYWSKASQTAMVCITTEDEFFILKYQPEQVALARENQEHDADDGYLEAFDIIEQGIKETVKSGLWVLDCFVYTNSDDKLKYFVGNGVEPVTIAHLEKPMYLLGYLENRLYLGDKELNVISYSLPSVVLEYQTAIIRRDFELADSLLPEIPDNQKTRVALFLEKQNLRNRALEITLDPDHKFDLAISLKNLKISHELAEFDKSDDKMKEVADLAVAESDFDLAARCMKKRKDLDNLFMLATATKDKKIFGEIAEMATSEGQVWKAFLANYILGNEKEAVEALASAEETLPLAALMARTYKNLDMTSEMVGRWKDNLRKKNASAAAKIADPKVHPNLFPDLHEEFQ